VGHLKRPVVLDGHCVSEFPCIEFVRERCHTMNGMELDPLEHVRIEHASFWRILPSSSSLFPLSISYPHALYIKF